jgi:hypothetical protein
MDSMDIDQCLFSVVDHVFDVVKDQVDYHPCLFVADFSRKLEASVDFHEDTSLISTEVQLQLNEASSVLDDAEMFDFF